MTPEKTLEKKLTAQTYIVGRELLKHISYHTTLAKEGKQIMLRFLDASLTKESERELFGLSPTQVIPVSYEDERACFRELLSWLLRREERMAR